MALLISVRDRAPRPYILAPYEMNRYHRLLAVAMMAGGWDGSTGPAPGFPRKGWKVRVEGILPVL